MKSNLEKKVFVICPVRNITKEEEKFIEGYVAGLEEKGYKVHYPPRDTNQKDPIGLNICSQNKKAIKESKEIHIYWNAESEGSLFDLGMSFAYGKPLYLINKNKIKPTQSKSFTNVLLALHDLKQKNEKNEKS